MFLELSIVGLAPAALVVLAGMWVRARPADEKSARRWLFFLFSLSVQGVRPRSRESHFLLCHPLYLGVCR